jgi:hypothetical protein
MDKQLGDVNFSGVLKAGIFLLILAVVIHVLIWWIFDIFAAMEAKQDPKPSPMFQKDQKAPEPRLQTNPPKDYQDLVASQKEILNSYGWINPEKGIVRIPIEEAMKRVVEKEKMLVVEPPAAEAPEDSGEEPPPQTQEQHP